MEKTYTQMQEQKNVMVESIVKGDMLFNFNGNQVEVFVVNGKEYFNMSHVGKALEITNVRTSTQDFNELYKVKLTNEMLQNSTENSIVHTVYNRKLHSTGESFLTECGVYRLVFKSRKQEAEKFQEWVFCEVLPQIRRTGGYIPVNVGDTQEMIEQRAKEIASKTIAIKDELIAQQQQEIAELQEENEVKESEVVLFMNDVRYLFNRTDYGCHSISEAFELVTGNVNGKRRFVKWFKENNDGYVDVLDSYVDERGSKIVNAIDLTEINTFHRFKDLCFDFLKQESKDIR